METAEKGLAEANFIMKRPVTLRFIGTRTVLPTELGDDLVIVPGRFYTLTFRGETPWKSDTALDFMICRVRNTRNGARCLYSGWSAFWDNWKTI